MLGQRAVVFRSRRCTACVVRLITAWFSSKTTIGLASYFFLNFLVIFIVSILVGQYYRRFLHFHLSVAAITVRRFVGGYYRSSPWLAAITIGRRSLVAAITVVALLAAVTIRRR